LNITGDYLPKPNCQDLTSLHLEANDLTDYGGVAGLQGPNCPNLTYLYFTGFYEFTGADLLCKWPSLKLYRNLRYFGSP
jgi:hypothetical protein